MRVSEPCPLGVDYPSRFARLPVRDGLAKTRGRNRMNLAEGSGSQGRNRNARYFNALGSAREVRACIHVALAWSYVEKVDADLLDEIERVIATLIRLIV